MDKQEDDIPETTDSDYRDGAIVLVILLLVFVFEMYLKPGLAVLMRNRAEVSVICSSIGLVHLLCPRLLVFLYNIKCPLMFYFNRRRPARLWHSRVAGIVFMLLAVINWFR
jgi:hypothetical protein